MIAIDVYFLLNFGFDFLLLQMTVRLMKKKRNRKRLAVGACIGAVWSCFALLNCEWPAVVLSAITYCLCPVGMCFVSCRPADWKEWAAAVVRFYLLACVTSGAMNLLYQISGPVHGGFFLIGLMGAMQLLIFVSYRATEKYNRNKTLFLKTELHFRGRKVWTTGIWDTGNRLCSLSGKPVHLMDRKGAAMLLEERELEEILTVGDSIGDDKMKDCYVGTIAVRMIPFCGIGGGNGWLAAFEIDGMLVRRNGRDIYSDRPLIGISKTMFCEGKEYRIILNTKEL